MFHNRLLNKASFILAMQLLFIVKIAKVTDFVRTELVRHMETGGGINPENICDCMTWLANQLYLLVKKLTLIIIMTSSIRSSN